MRRFTALFLALDATTRTNEKVELLAAYFREAPPADAAWALALMTGRRIGGATSTVALRRLAEEVSEYPAWLIDECHAATGDLSEAIALLVPGPTVGSPEPLHMTMETRVAPLAAAPEPQRHRILEDAWSVFDASQRLVFHKLIRGGFRVGVQKRLVIRAIAARFGVDPLAMAHRLSGDFVPTAERFLALGDPSDSADPSRPYPFYLAHPLGNPAETLGAREDWIAEPKWDGVRAQLIRREGRSYLWSRGEEPVHRQFPEIVSAGRALADGVVLDGEILAWGTDRPKPFAALQERLHRLEAPSQQPGLFEPPERAVFMAYDLLEHGGVDIRSEPFEHRRRLLEQAIPPDHDVLRRSPIFDDPDWASLESRRASARESGVEGLMLKSRRGVYGVGRTKPGPGDGWWKWKLDPMSVDAVLFYAQTGSGRRAGLLTDYTFAVRDPASQNRGLTPFAKAYSGLTQEEIIEVDAWIRRHTLRKMGPVRQVEPALVFEIGFEGIQRSHRHASGIAVRFPRILRWRRDKPAAEADTLQNLHDLLLRWER